MWIESHVDEDPNRKVLVTIRFSRLKRQHEIGGRIITIFHEDEPLLRPLHELVMRIKTHIQMSSENFAHVFPNTRIMSIAEQEQFASGMLSLQIELVSVLEELSQALPEVLANEQQRLGRDFHAQLFPTSLHDLKKVYSLRWDFPEMTVLDQQFLKAYEHQSAKLQGAATVA